MGEAKRLRTAQLMNYELSRLKDEQATNSIEQHNFDRLVRQGMIAHLKYPAFEGPVFEIEVERGLSAKVPKPPKGRRLL